MDAMTLLTGRVSCPVLVEPAPTEAQLELMLQAAIRSPDHGNIKPYRFIKIAGEQRSRLGELFAQAAQSGGEEVELKLNKLRNNPLRAPLVLVVVFSPKDHPKVPHSEQFLTAGCAAHGIVLAAHALELGAIWRTGDMSTNADVATALGLSEQESICGFIYLGTASRERKAPLIESEQFLFEWKGV